MIHESTRAVLCAAHNMVMDPSESPLERMEGVMAVRKAVEMWIDAGFPDYPEEGGQGGAAHPDPDPTPPSVEKP